MKFYSVKDIAKLLGTSEETVRRWIRSGKLKATMDSRKEGSVVSDSMLQEFLETVPKYASALATSIGEIVSSSAMFLNVLLKTLKEGNDIRKSEVDSDEVRKLLKEQIENSQKMIETKRQMISQLESEIRSEEEKLRNSEYLLNEVGKD